MKMICDVPDEAYKAVKCGTWCGSYVAEKMIANGTPIPDNATNGDVQALIDSLSGECERLHKENNELKAQINEVLDKVRDEIASLPTNNISRRYAFEVIDQYRITEIIDRHKK